MNNFARFVANAYASVDVSTGVESASRHQLTLMLYDAALKHMDKSRVLMLAGRIEDKGIALGKAVRIVEEGLKGTLDLSQGDLALNLKSLYEYIVACLLKANLYNDEKLLAEARGLLAGMRDTWVAIAPTERGEFGQLNAPLNSASFGLAAA
jgi:flagellar protein FliS